MEENKGCGCSHDHDHEGCGCSHDHEEPVIYVTFEDEDKEVACDVLGIFEVDAIEYIALAPKDEDEVLIYRYAEDGEDIKLDEITSDEEYEKVAAEFDDLFFGDLEESVEEE
ncbi:MAG: DUF1292 domain-containing protein [Cellulosilyticaceae bacterium]